MSKINNTAPSSSDPKPVKRMSRATKRWIYVGITALVSLAIAVPAVMTTTDFSSTPEPTPTSDQLSVETPEQKEEVSYTTAQVVAKMLWDDIQSQVEDEKTLNQINLAEDFSETDSVNKEAKVTFIAYYDLPANIVPEKTVKTFIEYLEKLNDEEDNNWLYAEATSEQLEGSNVVYAIKAWEDSENPPNPAIIEISFTKISATDETQESFEITISSTVY